VTRSLKQAVRIDPDDAGAHFCLGIAYSESGMYKEAIDAFKQAIRINPDDAFAHSYLGSAYAFLNDKHSALEQYKILKSLDSKQANILFNFIHNIKKPEAVRKGIPASVFATKDSNVYHRRNCSRFDVARDLVEFPSS
jgi:Tfp pilus assembly protein PilF